MEALAAEDLDRALELLTERLDGADAVTESEGLLLLARLLRKAGRRAEAVLAYDRLVRSYPVSRDSVGLLLGPAAGRWRALERLELLRAGEVSGDLFVTDVLALRRNLVQNRFQMREDRAEWELDQLRRIAEQGAAELPVTERVRLADGLMEIADLEETLLAFRELFADEIRRILRGHGDGGRTYKMTSSGPRASYFVPIEDRAGIDRGGGLRTQPRAHPGVPASRGTGGPAAASGVAATVLDAEGKVVAGAVDPAASSWRRTRSAPPCRSTSRSSSSGTRTCSAARPSRRDASTSGSWSSPIAGILAAGWFVGRTVTGEMKVAKLKSDFLSNVTHELKTRSPRSGCSWRRFRRNRVKNEEERREYLSVISREADRLTGLIQRVLDLARLEGKSPPG